MLFGPADSSELSLIVMPTEPSGPVLITSAGCRRTPAVAGSTSPARSIVTWPFATLIWPMSAACAAIETVLARMTHSSFGDIVAFVSAGQSAGTIVPESVRFVEGAFSPGLASRQRPTTKPGSSRR